MPRGFYHPATFRLMLGPMGAFKGVGALVTGGASGIGRAVALALAREGARVAVADLNGEGAARVAEAARALEAEALPISMDVRLKESVVKGVEAALRAFGELEVLVNAAGVDRIAPFWKPKNRSGRRSLP